MQRHIKLVWALKKVAMLLSSCVTFDPVLPYYMFRKYCFTLLLFSLAFSSLKKTNASCFFNPLMQLIAQQFFIIFAVFIFLFEYMMADADCCMSCIPNAT